MKLLLVVAALAVCSYRVCTADSGSSSQEESDGCSCGKSTRGNPCRNINATSTATIGCRSSNKFVQCAATTCTPQTCATGEVWNSTLGACAPCQPGFQVSSNNQTCICATGTTPTGPFSCGPCPTASTWNNGRCSCTSPLVLNAAANACQDCPTNALPDGDDGCRCNVSLFWNVAAWQCQGCPATATLTTKGSGRDVDYSCQCPAGQIFDRQSVACTTCPSPTAPDSDGDSCDCPISGQYYNTTAGVCQCPPFLTLNSAGTACQWVPPASPAGRRRRQV
jgi:hypothetical protein